jgi:hypothetical protein
LSAAPRCGVPDSTFSADESAFDLEAEDAARAYQHEVDLSPWFGLVNRQAE